MKLLAGRLQIPARWQWTAHTDSPRRTPGRCRSTVWEVGQAFFLSHEYCLVCGICYLPFASYVIYQKYIIKHIFIGRKKRQQRY